VAIEVKSSPAISGRHVKGLKAFAEEYSAKKLIVVSHEPQPRLVDNILILPWQIFLQRLWAGDIIA